MNTKVFISEAFDLNTTSVPPPIKEYVGIWDTGATNSVITKRIITELGLIPTGKTTIYHAQGQTPDVNTFLVNIGLPNRVMFPGVPVSVGDIKDADVLIGMDIIASGDFAVTRKGGSTCHTFQTPPTHTVDFVEELNFAQEQLSQKVGRNHKCPCGSGKKYKNCHGS